MFLIYVSYLPILDNCLRHLRHQRNSFFNVFHRRYFRDAPPLSVSVAPRAVPPTGRRNSAARFPRRRTASPSTEYHLARATVRNRVVARRLTGPPPSSTSRRRRSRRRSRHGPRSACRRQADRAWSGSHLAGGRSLRVGQIASGVVSSGSARPRAPRHGSRSTEIGRESGACSGEPIYKLHFAIYNLPAGCERLVERVCNYRTTGHQRYNSMFVILSRSACTAIRGRVRVAHGRERRGSSRVDRRERRSAGCRSSNAGFRRNRPVESVCEIGLRIALSCVCGELYAASQTDARISDISTIIDGSRPGVPGAAAGVTGTPAPARSCPRPPAPSPASSR